MLAVGLLISFLLLGRAPPAWTQSTASYPKTEGFSINARLFNSTKEDGSYLLGGLELSRDGLEWGYVCDKHLTMNTAAVVCKMFNYSHGEGIAGGRLGRSQVPLFPNKFVCARGNNSLSSCPTQSFTGNCTEAAGIICFNDIHRVVEMRVVDGFQSKHKITGRLEVRLVPLLDWGSVCDDGFSSRSATAVCRYMGYKFGETEEGRQTWYSDTGVYGSSNMTNLDELTCQAGQNFSTCSRNIWGQHDCMPNEDVAVSCSNVSVRLLSAIKKDVHLGSVELYQEASEGWFEVCDLNWDDQDAQVVCRELGYADGRAHHQNALGPVSYGSLTAAGSVTNVSCIGNETDLASCPKQRVNICGFNGSIISLASVICFETAVTDSDLADSVRIISDNGSSSDAGFLEIRHMGVWGRICEDNNLFSAPPISDKEASVACRMMNYAGGKRLGRVNVFNEVFHIWLRGLNCNGSEQSIAECNHPAWGSPGVIQCRAPVRVVCYHSEISLTLQEGSSQTGVLLVTHDNSPMHVCASSWRDQEANAACLYLGFNGGKAWTKEGHVTNETSHVIGGVSCTSTDGKLFLCIKSRWGVPRANCSSGPAGVSCFNQVKLDPGIAGAGILQIYRSSTQRWSPVCRHGFDDVAASVVCREMGYLQGATLPSQVFGFYTQFSYWSNFLCTGNESSLLNCSYNTNTTGCSLADYTSVSCFDQTSNGTLKVENGTNIFDQEASGVLRIYQNNTWGYACDDLFTSVDAQAYCASLGEATGQVFMDGVKLTAQRNVVGPYFVTYPNCSRAADNSYHCNQSKALCYGRRAASILCARDSAPKLELQMSGEEVGINAGRLQISINGRRGAICANSWTDKEAQVACRQLNSDYVSGAAKLYPPISDNPVYLSGTRCYGIEGNIFQCNNDGWKKINSSACTNNYMEAGVICFKTVFLKNPVVTQESMSGRLSLVISRMTRDVCFDDYFTLQLAEKACFEIGGYRYAAILRPQTSHLSNRYSMVKRITCPRSDIDLVSCNYYIGGCSDGQVRLLCYKNQINEVRTWKLEGFNPSIGQLHVKVFNQYTGLICPLHFKDREANITCVSRNHVGGVMLGSPPLQGNLSDIIWFGNVTCPSPDLAGVSSSCTFQPNVSRQCLSQNYSAGLLCFQSSGDFGLRLVSSNGNEARTAGRVEVRLNGEWGTICNQRADSLQARVICQQKGFTDGRLVQDSSKKFGNASGPIYLKDVTCNREDTSLIACSNAGWSPVSNCTHEDDLEVMCYTQDRLFPDPDSHFGAVTVKSGANYRLVCSDQFTDREATVFCQAQGFQTGKSICCSALRIPPLELGFSRVQCQGQEKSLLDCDHFLSGSRLSCPSQHFASVACSYDSRNEYILSLEKTDNGRVLLTYFGVQGTMCGHNFDHQGAQVVCREAGFSSGLAFIAPASSDSYSLSWASSPRCQGTERSLTSCSGFSLGNSSYCSFVASVVCLQASSDQEIRVRLMNGSSPNLGRLEVQINGTWGSVCSEQMVDADAGEANVICREMGFRGGQLLPPGSYGYSQGPVWLQGLNCNGSESRIRDCQMERAGGEILGCTTHLYDLAVECFSNARLINGPENDNARGQIQMYVNETDSWRYVCDTGLTDREATVICRSFGYQFGKQQGGSAAGPIGSDQVLVSSVTCQEAATDLKNCSVVSNGGCSSGHYAYLHCSQTAFSTESLTIETMAAYVGPPQVSRFGISGSVCNDGLHDTEAHVMCREMGFVAGQLLQPMPAQPGKVIMLAGLNCSGSEMRIRDCSYTSWLQSRPCVSRMMARILCRLGTGPIIYNLNVQEDMHSGQAEIQIDGRTYLVGGSGIDSTEASVFCRSISTGKYVYGSVYPHSLASSTLNQEVLMDRVQCEGNETSLLQCQANFLPPDTDTRNVAYVECHTGAELEQSPTGVHSAGILTLYHDTQMEFGSVCVTGFGNKEADVGCRMLGYEHGVVHCCMPFGYSYSTVMFKNFQCIGSESSLFQCKYEAVNTSRTNGFCSNRQEYVGLSCYNGTLPNNFSVSIMSTSPRASSGMLQVTYMGVPGSVCNLDWDDRDAQVACREMNFAGGVAYSHYRSTFSITENTGPFWLANVHCNGSEQRLSDCAHSGLGEVSSCEQAHFAGVLCTQGSDPVFRLAGTDQPHYGRVEVLINNQWGTICNRFFDARDAAVLCRQMGYVTGDVLDNEELSPAQGPVWQLGARCNGSESNINDCPHEGWTSENYGSCSSHSRDAAVFCYTSVRLGTGIGKSYTHGPVNVYENGDWYKVCSRGFTDASARFVCRELGFYDGRALCCSAYGGESASQESLHPNITLQCAGDENNLQQCFRVEQCNTSEYASVACFDQNSNITETDFEFSLDKDFEGAGRLVVNHMGIRGRICSSRWTDNDARVFCRGINFADGLAYQHSYSDLYMSASSLGPYWISGVSCLGNETSLAECSFNNRLNLDNCTGEHTAGVVCFNDTGIQYRLVGPKENAGRIEMSLDNIWGTICSQAWDDRDARVACRNLHFSDGVAEAENKYGPGSGPVWLRDVQCNGTEAALHQCPHTGMQNEVPLEEDTWFPWLRVRCRDHLSDATVFCFKEAKLNQKLWVPHGGLQYNLNDNWVYICDSNSFGAKEARVACKSLLQDYEDGIPIHAGYFGPSKLPIKIDSVNCTGNETSLSHCALSTGASCASNNYVSVMCFNHTLKPEDFNFNLKLSDDSIRTSDNHGILVIRWQAVWGRICFREFTDKEATVACKQLGFAGGVVYLHLFKSRLPFLWSQVRCSGDENNLNLCQFNTHVDHNICPYEGNDAGVVCYRNQGVHYRLAGGANATSGRVEIGIDGNYSSVCAVNWNTADARVLCRHLGYQDGVPSKEKNNSLELLNPLMSFFLCEGDEPNLLTCMNSGFDGGRNSFYCGGEAHATCFSEEVKIKDIRLGDGAKSEGRVEVYVTGMNQWGTVCDDDFGHLDAQVVCRYLGFTSGVVLSDGVRPGQGYIFLDNLECNGTERSLSECKHPGVSYHNCDHNEDVGVRCFDEPVTVLQDMTTSTQPSTSSSSPPTTSTAYPPTTSTGALTLNTSTASSNTSTSSSTTKFRPTISKSSLPTSIGSIPTLSTTNSSVSNEPSSSEFTPTQSPNADSHSQNSEESSNSTTVIVAVCVTILVAAVLIGVVVFLVFRYKIHHSSVPHKRFHDDDSDTIQNNATLAVSNRMFDLSNSDSTDPVIEPSKIQFEKAGHVTFSKGAQLPSSELQPHTDEGFANPLYSALREPQDLSSESTT